MSLKIIPLEIIGIHLRSPEAQNINYEVVFWER